jgi:hypothetical protein
LCRENPATTRMRTMTVLNNPTTERIFEEIFKLSRNRIVDALARCDPQQRLRSTLSGLFEMDAIRPAAPACKSQIEQLVFS